MKKSEERKSSKQLASPSDFCWNEECADYGRTGLGNIRKFGTTSKGRQRYQCKTCESTFIETRGTVFHGKQHDEETIFECLAMLADRSSLAAIHRIKGIKEETVLAWLKQAAEQSEQIEEVLIGDYKLSRAQLDALWTYVGHKGEKGGARKSRNEARSGAGRRSKPTPASGSDARSRRPKRKSRMS